MNIGDKVRFLSETGGGKVAGFQGKNIVLVEDEDGFQIPFPINEVVLIGEDNYATSKLVSSKMAAESKQNGIEPDGRSIKTLLKDGQDDVDASLNEEDKYDTVDDEKEVTFRAPVEERKGGNMLSAYIAFVPMDINNVTSTRFETYFVNDSNYYIQFCYMIAEGNSWNLKFKGEVEPNTKLYIEEFGRDALNDMNHIAVQFISYKLEKGFIMKPSVDAQFRIDPVKFYKLHTFQDTQFFESPALLYSLIVDDVPARPLVIDPKALKKEMFAGADNEKKESPEHIGNYMRRYEDGKNGNVFKIKHRGDDDIVVVDLHADELLDTTAGMTTADILNYQMKKFRDTLAEYANKKGQKIVFIHGKGEGVLRGSIINELHYRYKKYAYQDASFQEYGYGATQVTIR
ncbi:DUF2027 domain-containing protein [Segatella paludivivens]|uniref:DUF2027 domain-containing protein n=1 Tax=Segatella paludivivens TaxID=185294 RepID=UPI00035E770D|nr:DUF2027 domain-containing protein [Segatella paludivivens]